MPNVMFRCRRVHRRLTWRWGRKSRMPLSLPPRIPNPHWMNCAITSSITIHHWRCAAQTRGQSSSLSVKLKLQSAYRLFYFFLFFHQKCSNPPVPLLFNANHQANSTTECLKHRASRIHIHFGAKLLTHGRRTLLHLCCLLFLLLF